MTPLKIAIFREVRLKDDSQAAKSDEELDTLIFRQPNALRLNLAGFIILKKIFTAYSFEIPATLKTKHRYGMSKMEFPYFFTARRLILFSEMDAMVVKLAGGVDKFLETCSQLDN